MCNLSTGIKEEGKAEEIAEGKAEARDAILYHMFRNGLSDEEAAHYSGESLETIINTRNRYLKSLADKQKTGL